MWQAPEIQVGKVRGIPTPTLRELGRRLRRAGRYLGLDPDAFGDLGVRIVDDREMSELHDVHMGERRPTDVLSFPAWEETELGDIAIDWQAVARQARRPGEAGRLHEATILLVHGLVHLLGHDHAERTQARAMLRLERRILRALRVADVPRPYGGAPVSVAEGGVGTVTPVLVVHGGAGTAAKELHDAARAGVKAAAEAGRAVLLAGGGCEATVIAAIRVMEDDETYNAGRGACMTEAGEFEVDAAIMRSLDLRSGAIAGVKNLRDGILVAQAVMTETKHSLLVGDAVEAFAKQHDVGSFGRDEVWTKKAQARYDGARAGAIAKDNRADTVGAVALDAHGNLCVGGSTGGVLLKIPGRVGDTALVGPGFYAHPKLGAAAATGVGEAIMSHVMAYELLRRAADGGDLQAHAKKLCEQVRADTGSAVGIIAIRPDGQVAVAHASNHMSWAIARGEAEIEYELTHP